LDLRTLREHGWLRIPSATTWSHRELLEIAGSLGDPTPGRRSGNIVQELSPVSINDAHPKSLSAQHGTGEFPFHTDTAQWRTPAHYILFHAKNPGTGNRPTVLLSGDRIVSDRKVLDLATRALFKIVNGRNSFLSTMSEYSVNGFRLRYDEGCMEPVGRDAKELLSFMSGVIQSADKTVIDWQPGDVLVVDNWRILHARAVARNPAISENRILERILIR
jgi:L-asparagine oxygenase